MCSNRYCGKIKGKYPRITTLALLIVECHGSQWYLMTHYIVPEDIITHYTVPEDTEAFNSMWTGNFQMFNLDLEKAEEPEIKLPTSAGSLRKQEVTRKTLLLLYWLLQSFWLCGSQWTVGNSSRDGNARPPELPPEKSVCRSGSNS